MQRPIKRILAGVAVVSVLIVGALAMFSVFSRKPSNLGVVDGRLADCPPSPNCVSTQAADPGHRMEPIPLTEAPDATMRQIEELIAAMPRTKIVTRRDDYLHAEFRSAIFRFVDDVEFLIDPQQQLIHFRSASRAGYSDFGVNRRRMEQIRTALTE
jgi:uncharacterized protein (DUF1499 family)